MRKYVRPMSGKVEPIDGLNEAVFLGGSGDIWKHGPCFTKTDWDYVQTIDNSDGTYTQRYICGVTHNSHGFPEQHFNIGQNYVFYLAYNVSNNASFHCNAGSEINSTGQWSPNGDAVLFYRDKTANDGPDNIKYDDLEITFSKASLGLSDEDWADAMANGLFSGFGVNDWFLWDDNPNA